MLEILEISDGIQSKVQGQLQKIHLRTRELSSKKIHASYGSSPPNHCTTSNSAMMILRVLKFWIAHPAEYLGVPECRTPPVLTPVTQARSPNHCQSSKLQCSLPVKHTAMRTVQT